MGFLLSTVSVSRGWPGAGEFGHRRSRTCNWPGCGMRPKRSQDDMQVSEQDIWVGLVPSVHTGKPEGEQGPCVCACSVILWELGGGPREPQTCVIGSCGTFSLLSP